jgi:hypothetical protein
MNIIILLGQQVRSGTNFVGVTLSLHPDVICIPPNISLGEFNLFRDSAIKREIFESIVDKSFGSGLNREDFPKFMQEYGTLWVKLLIEKYNISEGKTIFIKSPFIDHVDLWCMAFPNSQIALLCRDGRDTVVSSIKATNDKRSWHTITIGLKKRINFYSGRFFLNYTRGWKNSANKYIEVQETPRIKKFKYEDLNNSEKGIEEILKFYRLNTSPSILNKCVNAPVVGSSFGIDRKGMVKPNWQPDPNKNKFVFSGKWHKWNFLKKIIFKEIAGNELISLNYEKDNNW